MLHERGGQTEDTVVIDLKETIGLEYPLIQAGMAGGISSARLASAVSLAGGLGTIGPAGIEAYEAEIIKTKQCVGDKPFSANILMPFATDAHLQICIQHQVPVVSFFYGLKPKWITKLKSAGSLVAYQVGSLEEAKRVIDAGADLLIVQGKEAGGHIRGKYTLSDIIPVVRNCYPNTLIFAAGGIFNQHTARTALSYGANGVLVGTRFLMSEESMAHPEYKSRLCSSDVTILTTLFGLGWDAPHRVLTNRATDRWINANGDSPLWTRVINRFASIIAKYVPTSPKRRAQIYQAQSISRPIYTPTAPVEGLKNPHIECSALYAGECVKQINSIERAADIVQEISRGLVEADNS